MAGKTVANERVGNTFGRENIEEHRRSPAPKSDWGLSEDEKDLRKQHRLGAKQAKPTKRYLRKLGSEKR